MGSPPAPRPLLVAAALLVVSVSLPAALVPDAGAGPDPGFDFHVLLVFGLEYTTNWVHFGVSGVAAELPVYTYQNHPIPPYEQRAADIMALDRAGNDPLWWMAHPNWRDPFYAPERQLTDLFGIVAATQEQWYPDAIGLLNVGIDPHYGGSSTWRRQLALVLGQTYSSVVAPDHIPAFVLETDFHRAPTLFYYGCWAPYTVLWVPENWHSLPAIPAMEAVFAAVRARRTLGTVGGARFARIEIDSVAARLELTQPIRNLQLWAGAAGGPFGVVEPIATWTNSAVASYPLAALTGDERYLFWFAYGDSLIGNWNTWSCRSKEVFFSSPILRTDPSSFANQYAETARQGMIPIKVFFHQHTRLSPDAPYGPDFAELITQCRTLGIDCVLTSDHVPGLVGAFPGYMAVWDEMPTTTALADGRVAAGAEGAAARDPLAALANPVRVGAPVEVRFALPEPAPVSVRLATAAGRVVRKAEPGRREVGAHVTRIDTTGLAAGIYFLELDLGRERWSRRMTLVP